MKRKTVAVVGNAAYMKGTGLGKEIDSHDIVVRINLSHKLPAIHSIDIGKRTDNLYLCIEHYRNKGISY